MRVEVFNESNQAVEELEIRGEPGRQQMQNFESWLE
jgi:hypothetical protein